MNWIESADLHANRRTERCEARPQVYHKTMAPLSRCTSSDVMAKASPSIGSGSSSIEEGELTTSSGSTGGSLEMTGLASSSSHVTSEKANEARGAASVEALGEVTVVDRRAVGVIGVAVTGSC